jgi:hypothetical protein
MVTTIRVFLFVVLIACLAGGAYAGDKRVALVIGNAAYTSAPRLRNTLNDADEMSAALKVMGFEVVDGRDLNKEAMDRILTRFARELQGAEAALFYYAGHGLQFLGQNYLVPVDAKVEDEFGLRFEATKLEDVISTLSAINGVRILVLDACRNNPFTQRLARSWGARGVGLDRGLVRIERSQGMLIAYATQPNEVAEDGDGRNSPFTAALVEEIKRPGLEVATIFRHVQTRVNEASGGRQMPELSLSLLGEFYFKREPTDIEVWRTVDVGDPEQLKAFMARFPDSSKFETARLQLDAIETKHELAESDLRLRQSNERLKQLEAEMRQAEDELAALKHADREHVSTPAPAHSADLASPVANAADAEARLQEVEADGQAKADAERLASQIEAQKRLEALQAEKSRVEAERAAVERAIAEQLAKNQVEKEKPAIAKEVDTDRRANTADPLTPPLAKLRRPLAPCQDLVVRAQLGELTEDDVEALKRCR